MHNVSNVKKALDYLSEVKRVCLANANALVCNVFTAVHCPVLMHYLQYECNLCIHLLSYKY